jgi:hypothetical protein
MKTRNLVLTAVLLACAAGIAALEGLRTCASVDPAVVTGAAPGSCFDCKDVLCGFCATPVGCAHAFGYCHEVVRNVSKFCLARPNAQYDRCKWRVDPAGSCVTELLNPCTPEHVVCASQIAKCGPMGVCIGEGVCTH